MQNDWTVRRLLPPPDAIEKVTATVVQKRATYYQLGDRYAADDLPLFDGWKVFQQMTDLHPEGRILIGYWTSSDHFGLCWEELAGL